MMPDRHAEIERRAYLTWEREGRPKGMALAHWLRAEVEFDAEQNSQGATADAPRRQPATTKRKSSTVRKGRMRRS
jgi:hypothetical protein